MKDITTGIPDMLFPLFAAIVKMEAVMGPRVQISEILGSDRELTEAWRDLSVGAQLYLATCDEQEGVESVS